MSNANWYVEYGKPEGDGWTAGSAFRDTASGGPFGELLARIGERLESTDRKVVAASFALRFGWAAAPAIAPWLLHGCVPNVALENISFKFSSGAFFERLALHRLEGTTIESHATAAHPSMESVASLRELLGRLRHVLVSQATPVVAALYAWSRFSKKALWGQIASSWGAQITNILAEAGKSADALHQARTFFDANGIAFEMGPDFYPITCRDVTRIYHRRGSCCLYYQLPYGDYCASCPLITHEESRRRQTEWLRAAVGG